MSLEERTGTRDLLYSRWHRSNAIKELVGIRDAARLLAIDVDFVEYHGECRCVLALVETQRSSHDPKPAPITEQLAKAAGVPAYSLSYRVGRCDGCGAERIDLFRVTRLTPQPYGPIALTPEQWAAALVEMRDAHICKRGQS